MKERIFDGVRFSSDQHGQLHIAIHCDQCEGFHPVEADPKRRAFFFTCYATPVGRLRRMVADTLDGQDNWIMRGDVLELELNRR